MPTAVTVAPTRNGVAVDQTKNVVQAEAVQVETTWYFLSPWHLVPFQEVKRSLEVVPVFLSPFQMVPITEVIQQP